MYEGKTKLGVEVRRLKGVNRAQRSRAWVVVADRSRLRIFEKEEVAAGKPKLWPVKEIPSLTGKLKDSELGSDRPGRGFLSKTKAHRGQTGAPRYSLAPRKAPKERELDSLLRKGNAYLESARNQKQFDTLEVYAEAHLTGRMKQIFSNAVLSKIKVTEDKDYAWLSGDLLRRRL